MKRKNHYLFYMFIAIILVITLKIQDNTIALEKESNDILSPGQTTTTTIPLVPEIDPFQTLTFNKDVNITKIKSYDNRYIAMGEENNVPYMQPINQIDKKTLTQGNPFLIEGITGTITDITNHDYYMSATIDDYYAYDFLHYNDTFIPFYKKQIQYNYSKGTIIEPEYLVIHETGNTGVGANAENHYKYWNNNPTAFASTHFVVDNTQVYQMLELNQAAWHVGDNRGFSDITNLNSIGIEIAVNQDGNYMEARQHTIELTIQLMKALDMDISQLKTHNDASGKNCPEIMLATDGLWEDFVAQVEAGLNE